MGWRSGKHDHHLRKRKATTRAKRKWTGVTRSIFSKGFLIVVAWFTSATPLSCGARADKTLSSTSRRPAAADGEDDLMIGDWSLLSQHSVVRSATDVLTVNYRDDLEATIPSPLIDAHQESTTSVLTAQAWAHVDQRRARSEMLSIFLGQWENGMVPTVRYAPGYDGDFLRGSFLPGPGGWGNGTPAVSERGDNTSALAALPLHADAALRIFDLSSRDAAARLWLEDLFPCLFRYHDYLHRSRNDPDTGLVYVYHPWETEISADSVLWPDLLRETRERAVNESWSPPPIPEEVSSIPGFPGEDTYAAAMYLADCAARHGREDRKVRQECPFLLQDVQFNAALVRSDKALLELANILEATRSGWQSKVYTPEHYERLKGWAALADSGAAMENLWSRDDRYFFSRYTSAITSEEYLSRPASSSSFSALLAPGVARSRSTVAVDVLLSTGSLSFRCGDHPIPDVECGYNVTNRTEGDGESGGDYDGVVVGLPFTNGNPGQESMLQAANADRVLPLATYPVDRRETKFPHNGAARGVRQEDGPWEGWRADSSTSGEVPTLTERKLEGTLAAGMIGGGEQATAAATAENRRVWVLHNLLAKRGFDRQGFQGIVGWLANSTLALLAPDIAFMESIESPLMFSAATRHERSVTFTGRRNYEGGEDIVDVRPASHGVEGGKSSTGGREFWAGGLGGRVGESFTRSQFETPLRASLPDRRRMSSSMNVPIAAAVEEGDDDQLVCLFYRGFDSGSGLPLLDAEGNSSSLAAAASVLLLLGDGPEGGNNFPPITHATLFVLMAIELAFSFAVGVSCLVVSVNLVRKLRDDDLDNIAGVGIGGSYIGGRGSTGSHNNNVLRGGDGVNRPGVTTTESVKGIDKRRSEEYVRGMAAEGGVGRVGPLSTPVGRGFGSLLPRNASAHRDMYKYDGDVSDHEDYGADLPEDAMVAQERRKEDAGGDVEWGIASSDDETGLSAGYSSDQYRKVRNGNGYDDNVDRRDSSGRQQSRRRSKRQREQSQGRPPAGGSPGGGGAHYYRTLPADNDLIAPSGRGTNTWSSLQPWRGGPLQEIPPHRGLREGMGSRGGSDAGEGGEGVSGRDEGGGGGGLLDIFKPFYASLKLW